MNNYKFYSNFKLQLIILDIWTWFKPDSQFTYLYILPSLCLLHVPRVPEWREGINRIWCIHETEITSLLNEGKCWQLELIYSGTIDSLIGRKERDMYTWFMSMVCKASPRVKIIAWFWFSGFPPPIAIWLPGSLIRYIS